MDSLPQELIELVLLWNVRLCKCDKNEILPLRLVCKAFDDALKPYIFKTIPLEFSKFLRNAQTPDLRYLQDVGRLSQAVYLNMMVIRDEEEITRLSEVFRTIMTRVPEMEPLLSSLRRYCMGEDTFEETDFRRVVEGVFAATRNMNRLKLNLPFQVVGKTSSTATLLLATTLACVAQRPAEEYKALETFVLDHLSDTTVTTLCNNHMDVKNAVTAFAGLRNLILSIKRQESRPASQSLFTQQLWFLIRKATYLESLCLIGGNPRRDINKRRHRPSVSRNEWSMLSMPYHSDPTSRLQHLRYLELKRVDVDPRSLLSLIEDNSKSLKEIYLSDVYIKIHSSVELENTPLWIGHEDEIKPAQGLWLAQSLRNMEGLCLEILRATGLGYDDFDPWKTSPHSKYDLLDPSDLNKSFDQRFVEAVFSSDDAPMEEAGLRLVTDTTPGTGTESPAQEPTLVLAPQRPKRPIDYDAEIYQIHRNTTSQYKRCLDGYFLNQNEQAVSELQRIIILADRGITLINAEMDRANDARVNPDTGTLTLDGQPTP